MCGPDSPGSSQLQVMLYKITLMSYDLFLVEAGQVGYMLGGGVLSEDCFELISFAFCFHSNIEEEKWNGSGDVCLIPEI